MLAWERESVRFAQSEALTRHEGAQMDVAKLIRETKRLTEYWTADERNYVVEALTDCERLRRERDTWRDVAHGYGALTGRQKTK